MSGSWLLHANEKAKIAFIGVAAAGSPNMEYAAQAGFRIAAVCGVWPCDVWKNFRKILADPSVEAVCIATPESCRAHLTVEACRAGKDVYVETPAFVCIDEGIEMVKAARQYQRVVQAGTIQRSGAAYQKAREIVKRGDLGHVTFCRGFFQGWPNGLHMIDTVQFVFDEARPVSVTAQASPGIVLATYRYPGFIASFESRSAGLRPEYSGTSFHGDKASLVVSRNGYRVFHNGNRAPALQGNSMDISGMSIAHWKNFLECIRTRARPNGDIETCVRTRAAAEGLRVRPDCPAHAESGMLVAS